MNINLTDYDPKLNKDGTILLTPIQRVVPELYIWQKDGERCDSGMEKRHEGGCILGTIQGLPKYDAGVIGSWKVLVKLDTYGGDNGYGGQTQDIPCHNLKQIRQHQCSCGVMMMDGHK